ncbi:MAG TPA: D-aminoacyl-tRNA deacylase [Vicinamibacterales bacterium]
MRSVIQRVSRASVTVDDRVVGAIGAGLVVFVGVAAGDGAADIDYTASKIRELRIFGDDQGRMNRSVVDAGGAVLVVSQFTLLADTRRGRRPGFDAAAAPEVAKAAYEDLVVRLRDAGLRVETGVFQAHMLVDLVNDGPVTILLDSRRLF